jgi:hypothetical protein
MPLWLTWFLVGVTVTAIAASNPNPNPSPEHAGVEQTMIEHSQ